MKIRTRLNGMYVCVTVIAEKVMNLGSWGYVRQVGMVRGIYGNEINMYSCMQFSKNYRLFPLLLVK